MNTEYIPFPTKSKRFHLRSDFPDEFCFREYVTCKKAQQNFYAAVANGRPLESFPFEDCDEEKAAAYPQKRFFMYLGVGIGKSKYVAPYIYSDKFWLPVERTGLFADLVSRVETTVGLPCESLLFPKQLETPHERWRFPSHVVLHDTALSSAALVPFVVGRDFLIKFNK